MICHTTRGEVFEGIEFPDGARSFADEIIRFQVGHPAPTTFLNPTNAVGVPDWSANPNEAVVSLGQGGLLELRFLDNRLSNSGDESDDLYVFEVGDTKEATFVAVRPDPSTLTEQWLLELLGSSVDANEDGFFEVGRVAGSLSSFDLDAVFPGFKRGQLVFDAVQLVDDPMDGLSNSSTVGADIDAVGALTSMAPPLVMSIRRAVEICWNTQSNALYQVEFRMEAESPDWRPLGSAVFGDGGTNCVCDPLSGAAQRLYRVRLVPSP